MVLEDLTLHEVACCECKKAIPAIPAWLADAKVSFQCEECRQKHPRIPGMADIDPRRSAVAADEVVPEHEAVVADADEEPEDELPEDTEEYAE